MRRLSRGLNNIRLPVIQMNKKTPKEAVCLIFEKVNTGGVSLNVFELLTATYTVDNYPLRKEWDATSKELKHQIPTKY